METRARPSGYNSTEAVGQGSYQNTPELGRADRWGYQQFYHISRTNGISYSEGSADKIKRFYGSTTSQDPKAANYQSDYDGRATSMTDKRPYSASNRNAGQGAYESTSAGYR